ncbi:MFS general substrate transporter [Rhizoclosmatium globosum]|uniref:MFS general substrate transporter n=1 Tax=Rhizoclosmatium globosum TaxID=329046 RepID=A0A1Y2CJD3_9FUNG|nr:MFS general substrate transporter [Rhizoclosmatium globosum]|eukprot:ORY47017.1 MFS general substrate transporter [Rhizoclosmatium globosum]
MGLFNTLNKARTQVYVIAVVCFLCPGMFNALNSLPTSGPSAQNVKDRQNAALYLCFAIMGLLAGGLNNILGPRILASVGGTGYAIYAAAQYNIFKKQGGDSRAEIPDSANAFSIFSGAYIGLCAGLLWAAQGQICLTYPTESQKGTFFATFWVIFNLGAVLGNTVGTILAWSAGPNGYAMNDAMYLVFIILMASGSVVAMLIQPPGTIIREDQTQVETPPTNVLREFVEILKLFSNPAMLTILIPCMSSGWYYTYEFGPFGDFFTGRSAGLKAIFYWLAQAAGAWVLGKMFLDNTKYPRTTRAWTGCLIMVISTFAFFGGGAAFQYVSSNDSSFTKIDAGENFGRFVGPWLLYICYGLYDAFFQTYVNYLIGAISNDSETLSRYAGFYKGTQSAAGGISWALNGFAFTKEKGNALSSTTQFWVMVIPCIVSLFFMALYTKFFVKDTTEKEAEKTDLEFESEYLQAV